MPGVVFRDETAAGRVTGGFEVAGLPGRMTVRELIRLRVREEVARHNARPSRHFNGLVRPGGPNGHHPARPRPIDWERQADIAERAFERNGFFVLAGDRQIEDLDEIVDLSADPELTFVRLVPPAGG
jgi:hypothetical protein